ncbi:hypothetical protein FRC00_010473 [Tulasnella sp. 408]|nr:hypothetical protein FRC00_010473 [Tulasnella sp. 408]
MAAAKPGMSWTLMFAIHLVYLISIVKHRRSRKKTFDLGPIVDLEIECKRDPDCLSSGERLNRALVLVRIPPSCDELEAAVRKKVEARKRLEAIKAASSGSSDLKKKGANSGEIGAMDKRRKLGQEAVWGKIMSSAKGSGSRLQRRESPTSRDLKTPGSTPIMKPPQSRNPFAKFQKGESKKKALPE